MRRAGRRTLPWLLLGAPVAAAVLESAGTPAFSTYFGSLNPIVATGLTVAVGFAALSHLESRGWFAIRAAGKDRKGLVLAAASASAFAIPVIVVDLLGGFPRDINVEIPGSILFYPVMAIVAEVAFHLMPLALLLGVAGRVARRLGRDRLVWSCILVVALIEPALQALWAPPESPTWATAYVILHVLVINLTGLHFLRRYDFLTTYLFRVFYYLHWHVLWGFLRLHLLFEV